MEKLVFTIIFCVFAAGLLLGAGYTLYYERIAHQEAIYPDCLYAIDYPRDYAPCNK